MVIDITREAILCIILFVINEVRLWWLFNKVMDLDFEHKKPMI